MILEKQPLMFLFNQKRINLDPLLELLIKNNNQILSLVIQIIIIGRSNLNKI